MWLEELEFKGNLECPKHNQQVVSLMEIVTTGD